ncbi:MAG: RNA-binding protein [Crocosphaera sp.]|nr:RNA-binding protein [Crocosphaera sp.]
MSIYVGNLSDGVTKKDLERVLSEYGKVNRVQLSLETEIREMRAVFFVEMETEADEEATIKALNGAEWRGSCLRVNKAEDGEERNLSGRGVTGHFN